MTATVSRETAQQVLALPMGNNDANATTVRGYLTALLRSVWDDGENFNGKRPFGNSGWDVELYAPLIRGGMVEGSFDEWEDIDWSALDHGRANALIFAAIDEMGHA